MLTKLKNIAYTKSKPFGTWFLNHYLSVKSMFHHLNFPQTTPQ